MGRPGSCIAAIQVTLICPVFTTVCRRRCIPLPCGKLHSAPSFRKPSITHAHRGATSTLLALASDASLWAASRGCWPVKPQGCCSRLHRLREQCRGDDHACFPRESNPVDGSCSAAPPAAVQVRGLGERWRRLWGRGRHPPARQPCWSGLPRQPGLPAVDPSAQALAFGHARARTSTCRVGAHPLPAVGHTRKVGQVRPPDVAHGQPSPPRRSAQKGQ